MKLSAGFMNDREIRKALDEEELVICPYQDKNLTPVGYNLTFSRFIISLHRKAFVRLHKEGNEWCFYLKPKETVLVLTMESIWVSKYIGGTFHSKVGLVTYGLGHISTTLDPGWQGQLLVPLNNPTGDKIRIVVATQTQDQKMEYQTFITMVLFRSETPAIQPADNETARIELLEKIVEDIHLSKRERLQIYALQTEETSSADISQKKEALIRKKKTSDIVRLKSIIYKIKQSAGYPEALYDLNDPEKRHQRIQEFKEAHTRLIRGMNQEFANINHISSTNYWWRQARFIGGVFFLVILLMVLAGFGFVFENGEYKDYVTLGLSIAIPFLILFLEHYWDRYL